MRAIALGRMFEGDTEFAAAGAQPLPRPHACGAILTFDSRKRPFPEWSLSSKHGGELRRRFRT